MKKAITVLFLILSLKSNAQPGTLTPKTNINKPNNESLIKNTTPVKVVPKKSVPSNTKNKPNINHNSVSLLPDGVLEMTIEPDSTNLILASINGKEYEYLNDTFILNLNIQPDEKYKLWVTKQDVVDVYSGQTFPRYTLYKQLLPKLPEEVSFPGTSASLPLQTIEYKCNDQTYAIQTNSEIIQTGMWIENSNGQKFIKIKKLEDDMYKDFYQNINGFTFHDGHAYTLLLKPNGADYILERVLCDKNQNTTSTEELNYPTYPNYNNQNSQLNENVNTGNTSSNIKNTNIRNDSRYMPIVKDLDSAIWYLRYLFQTDSLTPINDLSNTTYSLFIDKFRDLINIKTPCGTFEDKLRTDNSNKFLYESRTLTLKKCDPTSELLFNQLKQVNHFEIIANRLQLSFDSKVLIQFEGIPK
jgi:hypothetical protein